ncbi:uncharacterized protein LOC129580424 [Sitodiplosis mosellana]|uniref:uncharacterized protein LOC129580424 n=1 Tax=Sitodiplosis mosellana TaxID=263140 RepID=UPI002444DA34|nr:uncharacterized protein LOC129580424 [Sitodiplosis mosellana]
MTSELSGFRRFSHGAPPPRRGSIFSNVQRGTDLQRGSVVSIATTAAQTTGHSWCYILRAMQRQNYSLAPGFGICTCAIIINSHFYYFDIFDKLSDIYDGKKYYTPIDVLKIAMYFLGACIGSIVCGSYQNTWPARLSNYVIGAILFASCGFMFWINDIATCIARLLAGFCYAFTYITLITQVADNVMKTVRGYMASGLAQSTALGLILGIGFSEHSWKTLAYMVWMLRIILLAFPITVLLTNRFLTYEPITRLLKMEQETEAREVLDELRRGKIESSVIQYEIEERKLMLIEDYVDESEGCGFRKVFSNGNAMTLLWLVLLRILYVLTANMYLFILSAISIYQELNYVMHMVLMGTRLLIMVIPQYSIDKLGRRGLLLTSGLGSGILLLPFAAQHTTDIRIRGDLMSLITFGVHIFSALGIEPVQPIYASEAFPLSVRNGSIAIVTCVEYVLQGTIAILLLLGEKLPLQILLVVTPVCVLLLTIILFVKLPETKSMPLRRCRNQFNKNIPKKTLPSRVSSIHTLGSTFM